MMHPKYIVLHCSATNYGSAIEFDKWHRNNGWDMLGYHFIINNGITKNGGEYKPYLDGMVESGREEDQNGAHAKGFNSKALGVCLVGLDQFSEEQLYSLYDLLHDLMEKYDISIDNVIGHYETYDLLNQPRKKTCPNLPMDKVREWLGGPGFPENLMSDIKEHLASIYPNS